MSTADATTHIYVLLDRSGSMESIREEVVAGLNIYVAEQQAEEPAAKLTLVQFDSHDPCDVLVEAIPLVEATPFTQADFQPRGTTPLFDATVRMIGIAATRETILEIAGMSAEEIIVLTITDGMENASREFDLTAVRSLVEAKTAAGWSFVFLSAALDAYGEASRMGYADGSVQSFVADGDGTSLAMSNLSRSTSRHRQQRRRGQADKSDFFKDDKSG